jgi:phage shock protein E
MLKLTAVIFIFFALSCSSWGNKNYTVLKPAQFADAMSMDSNYVLLDVRTPEEFSASTLQGAVNIDYHAEDFSEQLSALDKDVNYYIYCRVGNRSHKTLLLMEDMKFKKVSELDGGIKAWEQEGLPVK